MNTEIVNTLDIDMEQYAMFITCLSVVSLFPCLFVFFWLAARLFAGFSVGFLDNLFVCLLLACLVLDFVHVLCSSVLFLSVLKSLTN